MKTKIILVSILLSAGLVTSASAAGRGNGNRGAMRQGSSQVSGGTTAVPRNPNSTGTPLRDGSGKATAPGRGAKDGTGNQANCPNPPTT